MEYKAAILVARSWLSAVIERIIEGLGISKHYCRSGNSYRSVHAADHLWPRLELSLQSPASDDVLNGADKAVLAWSVVSVMLNLACDGFVVGRY